MAWLRGLAPVVVLAMVTGACSGGVSPSDSPPDASTAVTGVERSVPDIDLTEHSVSLDQVLFDTFDGGSVSLADSTPELRARLLDAIPPIDDPVYESSEAGDWLNPDDVVVGYLAGDRPHAYPFKILNFHEIVNDELDGVPVLISYCPLCRSAIVYDRRIEGRVLEFGNTSALYESDMVMVDRSTGSYWWQVAGEAIVGPLTGTKLIPLPSRVATWEEWLRLHPDTLVLSRETGFSRRYEVDPFASYSDRVDAGQFAFPVSEKGRDGRLAASSLVVGVELGGVNRVYPVDEIDEVVNDVVGGVPIVVFVTGDGSAAAVFSSTVDGTTLQFEQVREDFLDVATASRWDATGRAIAGELQGRRLTAIPTRTTYWFAYVAAFPDVEVYEP